MHGAGGMLEPPPSGLRYRWRRQRGLLASSGESCWLSSDHGCGSIAFLRQSRCHAPRFATTAQNSAPPHEQLSYRASHSGCVPSATARSRRPAGLSNAAPSVYLAAATRPTIPPIRGLRPGSASTSELTRTFDRVDPPVCRRSTTGRTTGMRWKRRLAACTCIPKPRPRSSLGTDRWRVNSAARSAAPADAAI